MREALSCIYGTVSQEDDSRRRRDGAARGNPGVRLTSWARGVITYWTVVACLLGEVKRRNSQRHKATRTGSVNTALSQGDL